MDFSQSGNGEEQKKLNLDHSACPSCTDNIVILTMCLVAVKKLFEATKQDPYEYLKRHISEFSKDCEMVLAVAPLDGKLPVMDDEFMAYIQMRTVVHLVIMICLNREDAGRGSLSVQEYQSQLCLVSHFLCSSEGNFQEFLARSQDAKAVLAKLISCIELTRLGESVKIRHSGNNNN